ncbi:hypothetical protein SFRURICE_003932, partial [Spodoptera frugiperda]
VTGNRDRVSQQIQTKLGDYHLAQWFIDDPSKSIGICAEPPSPAPLVSTGLGRGITGGRSLCHADVTAPSWQRDAVHVTTSERDERLQMYAVRAPNELTLITDGLCD